jgi:hypothetical protein
MWFLPVNCLPNELGKLWSEGNESKEFAKLSEEGGVEEAFLVTDFFLGGTKSS